MDIPVKQLLKILSSIRKAIFHMKIAEKEINKRINKS